MSSMLLYTCKHHRCLSDAKAQGSLPERLRDVLLEVVSYN